MNTMIICFCIRTLLDPSAGSGQSSLNLLFRFCTDGSLTELSSSPSVLSLTLLSLLSLMSLLSLISLPTWLWVLDFRSRCCSWGEFELVSIFGIAASVARFWISRDVESTRSRVGESKCTRGDECEVCDCNVSTRYSISSTWNKPNRSIEVLNLMYLQAWVLQLNMWNQIQHHL